MSNVGVHGPPATESAIGGSTTKRRGRRAAVAVGTRKGTGRFRANAAIGVPVLAVTAAAGIALAAQAGAFDGWTGKTGQAAADGPRQVADADRSPAFPEPAPSGTAGDSQAGKPETKKPAVRTGASPAQAAGPAEAAAGTVPLAGQAPWQPAPADGGPAPGPASGNPPLSPTPASSAPGSPEPSSPASDNGTAGGSAESGEGDSDNVESGSTEPASTSPAPSTESAPAPSTESAPAPTPTLSPLPLPLPSLLPTVLSTGTGIVSVESSLLGK